MFSSLFTVTGLLRVFFDKTIHILGVRKLSLSLRYLLVDKFSRSPLHPTVVCSRYASISVICHRILYIVELFFERVFT